MFDKTIFLLALTHCSVSLANVGQIDPAFGSAGVAQLGLNDIVTNGGFSPAPVVQPDGKILMCVSEASSGSSGKNFLIARFTADGHPDATFNFDGIVRIDFADQNDICAGIALQGDGKIVVAGTTYTVPGGDSKAAVARMMSDGTLDSSFGTGGKVTLSFQQNAPVNQVYALVIQADQKIVVAGDSQLSTIESFAVARLNADGSNDTTFNLTGSRTLTFVDNPVSGNFDIAMAMAIDHSGNLVLAGQTNNDASVDTNYDIAVARITPSGALDPNFNANGKLIVPFNLGGASGTNNDAATTILIADNDDIILGGAADEGTTAASYDAAVLVRLLPNGDFAQTFGTQGKLVLPFPPQTNTALALALIEQENGKIIIGAFAANLQNKYAVSEAARLNADGTFDPEFGSSGVEAFEIGGGSTFTGMAFQGTQIIALGQSSTTFFTTQDAFMVRLQNDLIFASGF